MPENEALRDKIDGLESRISELGAQHESLLSQLKNRDNPQSTVDRHIKLLHDYNEIRDLALNFAGKIAEKERVPTADVLKRLGIEGNDLDS